VNLAGFQSETDLVEAVFRHPVVVRCMSGAGRLHLFFDSFDERIIRLGTLSAVEAAGCRLLRLQSYSPDLNPIEQTWSKLKSLLCSAAARTKQALEEALTAVIKQITAADARGWFAHCGYRLALH